MIGSTRSSIILCSVAALVAGVGCTDPDREQADTNEGGIEGVVLRRHRRERNRLPTRQRRCGRHRLPREPRFGRLFDADGDGDLDAYLMSARDLDGGDEIIGDGNRFFRNRGDGTFVDDTDASGLADDGFGCGVATGDVDGDGDLDVYLANLGPDRLFINDGLEGFELADDDRFANDAGFSVAPCFLDYDRDGDLDLFVCATWTGRSRTRSTAPISRATPTTATPTCTAGRFPIASSATTGRDDSRTSPSRPASATPPAWGSRPRPPTSTATACWTSTSRTTSRRTGSG